MFKKLTYKSAGMDIAKVNTALTQVKGLIKKTQHKAVMSNIGLFGSLFDLKALNEKYKNPVLIQSIDGVGTKMKVAGMMKKYDTVGYDIVNHSCNDIVCQGAKPITFLDYIAGAKIDPKVFTQIIKGMAEACVKAGVSLVGGETAEMPGVYEKGEYDLAGTISGLCEKSKIITGVKIKAGDVLLGLASNGLHTNGYSLARKIFFGLKKWSVNQKVPELGTTIGEALLKPHLNYSNTVLDVLKKYQINGIAHITGGGLPDNIERILPYGLQAQIVRGTWKVLPIFQLIQKFGKVEEAEMYKTFNMGVGMVLAVKRKDVAGVMRVIKKGNVKAYEIGRVVGGKRGVEFV